MYTMQSIITENCRIWFYCPPLTRPTHQWPSCFLPSRLRDRRQRSVASRWGWPRLLSSARGRGYQMCQTDRCSLAAVCVCVCVCMCSTCHSKQHEPEGQNFCSVWGVYLIRWMLPLATHYHLHPFHFRFKDLVAKQHSTKAYANNM